MVDCDAIVVQLLEDGGDFSSESQWTALDALLSGNVYYKQTPQGQTSYPSSALVVVIPEGGQGATSTPTHERSYLIHCYGGDNNYPSAVALYRAVFDVLNEAKNVTVTAGVFMGAVEEQSGIPIEDPKTQWRLVAARFACRLR